MITNGLLFISQYSFRKHHSTELTALELTDNIRREIDQKKIPVSVYLDLARTPSIMPCYWKNSNIMACGTPLHTVLYWVTFLTAPSTE